MAITRLNNWIVTILDNDGNPAQGYRVKAYIDGSNTPTTTYINAAGGEASWPIIVPASGVLDIYISDAIVYKFVVENQSGTPQRTIPNVSASGGGIGAGIVYTDGDDETPSYLSNKIISGTNISITVDETDPADHKLVVSAADAMLNDLQGAYDDGNDILIANNRPIDVTKNYTTGDSDWLTYSEDSDVSGSDNRFAIGNDELRMSDTTDQYVMLSTRPSNARFTLTNGKYRWKEDTATDAEYYGSIIGLDELGLINKNASYTTRAYFTVEPTSASYEIRSDVNQYVRETVGLNYSKSINIPSENVECYHYTSSNRLYRNDMAGTGEHNSYIGSISYFRKWECDFGADEIVSNSVFIARTVKKPGGATVENMQYVISSGHVQHSVWSVANTLGRKFSVTDTGTGMTCYDQLYRGGNTQYSLTAGPFWTYLGMSSPDNASNILGLDVRDGYVEISAGYSNAGNLTLRTNGINLLSTGLQCANGHIFSGYKTMSSTGGTTTVPLATGNFHGITTTGTSFDMQFTGAGVGGSYGILIDLPAGATVTWPTNFRWPGGTAPTFTDAGEYMITFLYDGNAYYGTSVSAPFS